MKYPLLIFSLFFYATISAQITTGIYHYNDNQKNGDIQHEIKMDNDYFVLSVYQKKPAKFIKTMGGFYTVEGKRLKVKLEFNSNHAEDGISQLDIAFKTDGKKLILDMNGEKTFAPSNIQKLDLDGKWLITGRGGNSFDKSQVMTRPRKTMKFLLNGHFQWIAYNSETFQFSGTGGGTYTTKDGVYTENIEFFSRDNSRVGAALNFKYEVKNGDWHHSGKSSKGKDIYEVWSIRF